MKKSIFLKRRFLISILMLVILIYKFFFRENANIVSPIEPLLDIEKDPIPIFGNHYQNRHLLSADLKEASNGHFENKTKHTDEKPKCLRPDIEQFPRGFLSQTERRHGAVIVHFLIAFYMFIALAIVVDDYFVPSLEVLSKKFSLKEDVAGATLMASGSSAPELATSVISLFVAKDVDIAIGTVVGSAVFNIMFVISIVALLSGMIICLSSYPIIRDSLFYLISIFVMILVIMDEKVYWYEALIFLILYAGYIAFMFFNSKVEVWFYSHVTFFKKPDHIQIEGSNYNTLRDDLNTELKNSHSSSSINLAENSEKDEIEKTDSELASPFSLPSSDLKTVEKIKFFLFWPITFILFITVPNSKKKTWAKFYLLTFIMSLVWLSIFSYLMVWMITIIGYTFLIPDTVMGITLIAFGASIPDCLSSLLVAKNGLGDMAISNAIGSNVFDILVCLGVPWLFRCMTNKSGHINVKSKGLTYSTITLFGTVLILVSSIHANKWQLDKKLGIFLMIVYLLFILLSSLYELNILGSNHLPMCTDSLW